MPLILEKISIKSTPFLGGMIEFQVGYLKNGPERNVFRYTRSMKAFRGYFRITLQYESDQEHTPYVFNVIRNHDQAELTIKSEGEAALKASSMPVSPLYKELQEALHVVYSQDIEKA